MAEASTNRLNRLSKRRRLNIDNAIRCDNGEAFNTPKSQRVGDLVHGSQSPSIIDLTGSDDDITATPAVLVLDTPGSIETSADEADEATTETSDIAGPGEFSNELKSVQVPRAALTNVAFSGWHPPDELWPELDVLSEHFHDEGTLYFELDDFTIYRPQTDRKRSMEMSTLDKLQVGKGVDQLCFSGRLSMATESYYVQNVAFSTLAIDGYGDNDCASLSDMICIQSKWAQSHDTWYRLGRPSTEYKSFYKDFIWLATFTKYFIDFLIEQEKNVTLHFFRSKFTLWMIHPYGQSADFQVWHQECDFQQDFGTSAAAYVGYLYKECYSIDDPTTQLLKHPIWSEINPFNLTTITPQPTNVGGATVVTPFAFGCFQGMYFAAHLEMVHPTPDVQAQISRRKLELCLTPWNTAPVLRPHSSEIKEVRHLDLDLDVQQGDVVCTNPNVDNHWKRSKSEVWFAYVTGVHKDKKGRTKLDILWLYEPADTTLGDAYYPFQNELFLSDNCSCGDDAIPLEAVIAKTNVSWFVNDPHAADGYFVRQKFQTVEAEDSYGFTTLSSKDFGCHDSHLSEFELCRGYYKAGQSVLARPRGGDDRDNSDLRLLQPMQIICFDVEKQRVILRRFERASWTDSTAPPNELLDSTEEVLLAADHIIRACEVHRFPTRKKVPFPFNRGGLADYFYLLDDSAISSTQTTLQTPPDSENDYDSKESKPTASTISSSPLVGLDLYCGGGNFGRGLEEAGIVKMRYAVDWDAPALHSYRANTKRPESVKFFLGSVNDYLRKSLRGSTKAEIACIGSIDFVSAGSPCPGFSTMQPNKQSDQSLLFASMVASVVAYVDTYSLQYFILENVVPMTYKIVVNGREQNVFSQILASLVALGYQVQQFLGDAWNFGSCQSRSRVFIVASAPGTVPLQPPPNSHGQPPGKEIRRNLGRTTNGLPFGVRRYEDTPCPYVSAKAATADLPDIGDSLTQICPRFPDHRTHADQSLITRQRLARVPIYPRGTGLCQAVRSGNVTSGEAHRWVITRIGLRAMPGSKSYSRIKPDGLLPTILTDIHLQCAMNGRVLHWDQHRSISIMEARRVQGFLDHEVIVGLPSQQLKIVGNSVDRKVAFVMGLDIKRSRDSTLRLKREMLGGNASVDNTMQDQEGMIDGLLRPSHTQVESVKRELSQMRTEAFATILRRLQHRRQKLADQPDTRPESQRWSGKSPADSIAIRRLQHELNDVLPIHQGHPSTLPISGAEDSALQ